MMRWFVLAGGGIVVVGVVVVLIFTLTTGVPGSKSTPEGPDQSLPPLANACPPPTEEPPDDEPAPEDPGGKRTVDSESGISYAAYGDPWTTWSDRWVAGDLAVEYATGQSFVTETYSKGKYRASILSGHVPAAVNDGTALDLECVSGQVAADVRTNYYPQPTKMKAIRDESATLGGRPAWLRIFKLSFHEKGLKSDSEMVGVALVDVGNAEAAVLYVSIPSTASKYDDVVDEVMESARPTSK